MCNARTVHRYTRVNTDNKDLNASSIQPLSSFALESISVNLWAVFKPWIFSPA